jgi:hypothetical protein
MYDEFLYLKILGCYNSLGESILEALNESGESDDWDSKGYV